MNVIVLHHCVQVCEGVSFPPFQPKQNKVIETDENAKKEEIEAKMQQAAEIDEAALNDALARLKELLEDKSKYQTYPDEFEKVLPGLRHLHLKGLILTRQPDRIMTQTSTSTLSQPPPTCVPTTTLSLLQTGSRRSASLAASCLLSLPPPLPSLAWYATVLVDPSFAFAKRDSCFCSGVSGVDQDREEGEA